MGWIFLQDTVEIGEPWQSGECSATVGKSWWEFEPNVDRVVNGCPNRVDRIKALGNGVVPLQVKTAFQRLMGIEKQ